jgi:hypothetical protein
MAISKKQTSEDQWCHDSGNKTLINFSAIQNLLEFVPTELTFYYSSFSIYGLSRMSLSDMNWGEIILHLFKKQVTIFFFYF